MGALFWICAVLVVFVIIGRFLFDSFASFAIAVLMFLFSPWTILVLRDGDREYMWNNTKVFAAIVLSITLVMILSQGRPLNVSLKWWDALFSL